MIYQVENLPHVIPIGIQTSDNVNRIGFDVSAWLEKWPGMSVSVWHTLPGQDAAYEAESTLEGGILYWIIRAADTACEGSGIVEILGETADKRILSGKTATKIEGTSLVRTTDPPDAFQSWYERLLEKINASGGGAQGNWAQQFPDQPDYIHNRTHYETHSYDFANGTVYPTPKVEAQLLKTEDGTASGVSLHKVSDVTPTVEDIQHGGTIDNQPLTDDGRIVNVTEDGYTITFLHSYGSGSVARIAAVVCFRAGYTVTGYGLFETGTVFPIEVTATLPEPGLYLYDADGAEVVTLRHLKWDGYVSPLDSKYLPKDITIPAGGTLTLDKAATISDPGNLLGRKVYSALAEVTGVDGDDYTSGVSCTLNKTSAELMAVLGNGGHVSVLAPVPSLGTAVFVPLLGLQGTSLLFCLYILTGEWVAVTVNEDDTAILQIMTL